MLNRALRNSSLQWHGVKPFQPDWSDQSHSVGMLLYSQPSGYYIYMFVNAWWDDLVIELPPSPAGSQNPWYKIVDTARKSDEIPSLTNTVSMKKSSAGDLLRVKARSVIVFISPNC